MSKIQIYVFFYHLHHHQGCYLGLGEGNFSQLLTSISPLATSLGNIDKNRTKRIS